MAKQQEIDRLREENARLKARLRYQERTAREGAFGSSTPSSKIPIKPNRAPEQPPRQGGARPGHPAHGRRRADRTGVERTESVPVGEHCPHCGTTLQDKGHLERTVLDVEPLRWQLIRYQLQQKYCPRCRRSVSARAPGVLPRHLLGNRLLTRLAVQHYLYGVTLGQLEHQLGVGYSALVGALHGLAKRLAPLMEQLVRAMHLRGLALSARQFRRLAAQTRCEIQTLINAPAQHPAIQKIQTLFREKAHRMYHWARDRSLSVAPTLRFLLNLANAGYN